MPVGCLNDLEKKEGEQKNTEKKDVIGFHGIVQKFRISHKKKKERKQKRYFFHFDGV